MYLAIAIEKDLAAAHAAGPGAAGASWARAVSGKTAMAGLTGLSGLLRRTGLVPISEELKHRPRVLTAGPTTRAARRRETRCAGRTAWRFHERSPIVPDRSGVNGFQWTQDLKMYGADHDPLAD
jgi:hypothetical protein